MQRKFLGLDWKQVRNVREMSVLFSLYSGINILVTHLADSKIIRKISVKTV